MHDVVDVRSDTLTLPTPLMREAMARADVGDDVARALEAFREITAAW
jgi:threonine aldolase